MRTQSATIISTQTRGIYCLTSLFVLLFEHVIRSFLGVLFGMQMNRNFQSKELIPYQEDNLTPWDGTFSEIIIDNYLKVVTTHKSTHVPAVEWT